MRTDYALKNIIAVGEIMRQALFALLGVMSASLAGMATAATYTYHYSGALLDVILVDPLGEAVPGTGYSATLILDETLLGKSLRTAELSFSIPVPEGGSINPPPQGFLGFFVNSPAGAVDPFNTVAGADFHMRTDSSGNIISGILNYYDGPPDGSFGSTTSPYAVVYDRIQQGSYELGSSRPGRWTTVAVVGAPYVAAVPLPAPIFMLLVGLFSLAVVRSKRALEA